MRVRDSITPADGHARMRGRHGGGSRLDGAREKKCREKCYGMLREVKWNYEMQHYVLFYKMLDCHNIFWE